MRVKLSVPLMEPAKTSSLQIRKAVCWSVYMCVAESETEASSLAAQSVNYLTDSS